MQRLCCFGVSPKSAFRERLPEHIKNLTVDVTYTKTEVQPKCVPSPKVKRFAHDRDSDSDKELNASFIPNLGCSKS